MLFKNPHRQKLSFIAIFFLIIISVLSTISTQADTETIGSEGGTVDAGHDSYLIIPEGALTETTLITADSFEEVITTDDTTILAELNNALSLLDSQFDYINSLSTVVNDLSGEWAEYLHRFVTGNRIVTSKARVALSKHTLAEDEYALAYTRAALDKLDVFDADLDDGLASGKISSVAYDNMRDYNDDIRAALELVEALHYEVLVFEFAPEETEFMIPVELVVPWEEILYNDALFWYSCDGEIIDLVDMDYFIDEENETVHFFIDHFSEYYCQRR